MSVCSKCGKSLAIKMAGRPVLTCGKCAMHATRQARQHVRKISPKRNVKL